MNLTTRSLEGLKVNKNGEVLNEDGDVVAKLSEGELADVKGKKINDKGEILDKEGNVIGKVEGIPQEVEAAPEEEQEDPDALVFLHYPYSKASRSTKRARLVDRQGQACWRTCRGRCQEDLEDQALPVTPKASSGTTRAMSSAEPRLCHKKTRTKKPSSPDLKA